LPSTHMHVPNTLKIDMTAISAPDRPLELKLDILAIVVRLTGELEGTKEKRKERSHKVGKGPKGFLLRPTCGNCATVSPISSSGS